MSPLLWFSILAGTAPLVAATIPLYLFKNGINPRTFQALLGLSAGLLFAIATLELIPEAFEMAELANSPTNHKRSLFSDSSISSISTVATKLGTDGLVQNNDDMDDDADGHEHGGSGAKIAMLGLGAGYFFLVMLEQLMSGHGHSHSHSHSHTHTEEMEKGEEKPTTLPGLSASFSMVAFVGLGFHSLVDGLIIAGAFTASPETGSRVALAILLHKFPDGFVMSSIVASQHAKNPSTRRYLYIAAIAGMTPIGAMIGATLLGGIPPVAVSFVLGFGAGTFLYITATGILPELASGKGTDKLLSLVSVVVGYLAFLIIDTNMHAH